MPDAERTLSELSLHLWGDDGEAYQSTDFGLAKAKLGSLEDLMITSFAGTPEGERGLQRLLADLAADDLPHARQ